MSFYRQFLLDWWKSMTPTEFVVVQSVVLFIGWILMKNMNR